MTMPKLALDQEAIQTVMLFEQLGPEQQRMVLYAVRLMLCRQLGDRSADAKIRAIQEAAEDGRVLPVPLVH